MPLSTRGSEPAIGDAQSARQHNDPAIVPAAKNEKAARWRLAFHSRSSWNNPCDQVFWCRWAGSNCRPSHYECAALPAELQRRSVKPDKRERRIISVPAYDANPIQKIFRPLTPSLQVFALQIIFQQRPYIMAQQKQSDQVGNDHKTIKHVRKIPYQIDLAQRT